MAALFQLTMRNGPTTGKVFPLEASEIIIGRDASSGVAINDAEVSRKHAKLNLQGTTYVIQDLGSTNGTFVNGQRITTSQVLNPGDTVSFGENIALQYDVALDPNATMLSSPRTPETTMPVSRPLTPPPAPAAAPAPAPAPFFSGQVPAAPSPAAKPPVKKGGGKIWIILVIVIVLILCLCVLSPIIADALKLDCMIPFKWLFNIIGPMFGYGSCS